ncbi:MAG: MmgE/PrpD family protein [Betaproteobacteria bacterium]|nr:MAG: MmgE/PrpD family protein [Betaproteobacteria bacterium]
MAKGMMASTEARTQTQPRPITRELASFASKLRYEKIPEEVRKRVLLLTLDQIGAALVASTLDYITRVREYALEESPDGLSTVIGSQRKLRPEWAALSNATAGHGVEIDDYHNIALAHPGCVAVPSVLAVAEQIDARGHETMVALALGFEAIIRFGLSVMPSMIKDRGFHETCVMGVFGSALGAGRLLRLDPETLASALGLAASHASGTTEYAQSGGEVKRLHAGLAAMGGLRALSLARRGFSGPPTILEGRRGVFQAFSDEYRADAMVEGLGNRWDFLTTAIKPYCCCGLIHSQIDALRALMAEEGLRPDDVLEMIVGTDSLSLVHVNRIGARPTDMNSAQFSSHFSLAMALVMGGNDFAHYVAAQSAGFRDPAVVGIAEKIRLELDPEAEAAFPEHFLARVRVKRRDGSTIERTRYATGTPDAPLTEAEIRAKYRRMAGGIVGDATANAIERAIDALADNAPARDVLRPLSAGTRRS